MGAVAYPPSEVPVSDDATIQALERALAATLRRFEALPDLFTRPEELVAGLLAAAQAEPLLTQLYLSKDGHRTALLRAHLPRYNPVPRGLPDCYDVALLDPAYLRAQPLEVAANLGQRGAQALKSVPRAQRATPLLAAMNLRLVEALDAATVSTLLGDLNALAIAAPDAPRRYLAILCRHWDLQAHLLKTLEVFTAWATLHPDVSLLLAQSHYDDIGHVYGGRYLNRWSQTAPLAPL
jgi:hypothetical protein